MNTQVKELWLTALRSGKYQQSVGALRIEKFGQFTYDCMGILTLLYCQKNQIDFRTLEKENGITALHPKVMLWADLENAWGIYGIDKNQSLVTDNDNGKSFKELAMIIEKEF